MDAQLETQESFINFLTNATMDQMSQKFQEVTDYTEYINQLSLDAQTTEALMGGLEGVFQGVGAMMTGFDWGEEIGAEKPPPPGEDWSSYLYRQ